MTGDRLSDLTWTELAERAVVLVVPVGSIEQHGPHLPLDTDTRIAVELAERAVVARHHLVLAPPIAIGASGEHAGFAGTLSIGTETLMMVLVELGRSADHFAGAVFVNGHGGNATTVREATALLRSEGRKVIGWSPTIPEGDAHAGRTETSMLLAIDPGCVRLDRLEAGNTEPIADLLDRLRSDGLIGVTANGILGDPTAASLDEGHELLVMLTESLLATIDDAFPASP
jgi:creatinine amidohydrolase